MNEQNMKEACKKYLDEYYLEMSEVLKPTKNNEKGILVIHCTHGEHRSVEMLKQFMNLQKSQLKAAIEEELETENLKENC